MKKIIAILLSVIMILSMAACSTEPETPDEPVNESNSSEEEGSEPEFTGAELSVGVLQGPTGMGAAWLMDQSEQGLTVNKYDFTVAGAADELTGRLIQGDLDIAALPTNAISTLYNKTEGKIVCLGINTLGVLYILEHGEEIQSIADLEGKTILASGKGSTAEMVINYLLSEGGVNAEIYWASEHTEAATLALTGEYDVVMLPEPFVTNVIGKSTEAGNPFRAALNLADEWKAITGKELTMGGIAIRKELVEENPRAVAEFIKDYHLSIEFTNQVPTKASTLIEKYDIAKAAVAEKAIPRCNIVWITGAEYETMLEDFLTVLYGANPQSIGGNMPGEDFYR